jgi:hypothetical protein
VGGGGTAITSGMDARVVAVTVAVTAALMDAMDAIVFLCLRAGDVGRSTGEVGRRTEEIDLPFDRSDGVEVVVGVAIWEERGLWSLLILVGGGFRGGAVADVAPVPLAMPAFAPAPAGAAFAIRTEAVTGAATVVSGSSLCARGVSALRS